MNETDSRLESNAVRRRIRLAGLGILCLTTLALAINVTWIARHIDRLRPISPGDIAPGFALPAIDDHGHIENAFVDLGDLRGDVVLVDFWATWCKPCRDSLPAIDRVHRRYRERGLRVVSVNTDDPAGARDMMRRLGLSLPLYADNGTVADLYRVRTIPHMVLIDHLGVIRHVHRGFEGERTLDAQVSALLEARP